MLYVYNYDLELHEKDINRDLVELGDSSRRRTFH